jgi:predicted acyl esterase
MRAARAVVVSAVAIAIGAVGAVDAQAAASAKAPARTVKAPFKARGSIGEAYVLGAHKGDRLQFVTVGGRVVGRGIVDRFGSLIFRDVKPGAGYTVRQIKGHRTLSTKPFAVLSTKSNPPHSFFARKKLAQGLNYVTVRDGVELAMTVRLPAGKTLKDGPFPTIVELSGYQTAAPHDLFASIAAAATGGKASDDPLLPATSTAVGSLVAPLLGFATVSVQMRGSGCSGGAFDLFGLPSTFDGYDAVETVAAQPWVKGHKVGMGGISFSGITQLFTAGTRPPHLAAIAPMSITDDLYSPGGLFNKGFALSWIKERESDAEPAPKGGQAWAKALTKAGDKHCIANQKLRLQTPDFVKLVKQNEFRTPSVYDERSPSTWIKRIKVPTFLLSQFQDEQTGAHFAEAIHPLFKNKHTWITMQNGPHVDSLGPTTVTRWVEFLQLFVGDEIPKVPDLILNLSSKLYDVLASAPTAPVKQSRFTGTTDVAAAKATFARDPRMRILMDNGAGPQGPGSIGATWELDYDSWPIPQLRPTPYYLGPGGALGAKPATTSSASYRSDPKARPATSLPVEAIGANPSWTAQPAYTWKPLASGKGLGFTTPPLAHDLVIAGTSSLDVYLKSSARDTDLQVTLSEVRPDGNETYVQNGWLRASHRKVDAKRSTANDPVQNHLERDARPLPKGRYTLTRVQIYPVAHAFRAGSRLRVTIEAPGGDRTAWVLATIEKGHTTNTIGLGGGHASKLVLPVLPGVTAKGTPLPAPTALRGEPNRTYVKAANGG